VVHFGKRTIYQCLLSELWGTLSGPWSLELDPVDDPFVEEELGVPPDGEAPSPEPDDEPYPRSAIPLTEGERSAPKRDG
jgi:hypothetical protein